MIICFKLLLEPKSVFVMGLDIYIKTEFQNWSDPSIIRFGEINPREQESLFFKDFYIKTFREFIESGENRENYKDYLVEQYAKLQIAFPLISRLKEHYEDAFFSKDEISLLLKEIKSIETSVEHQPSKDFLSQLSNACKLAQENNAGLVFLAD